MLIEAPPTASAAADSLRFEVAGPEPGRQPEFGSILDVASADDGRLVVLEGSGPELVVLDSLGEPLARFGREGEGPGELRALGLTEIVVRDQAVLVPDLVSRRVTRFGLDGTLLDGFALLAGDGMALDWTAHPAGGFAYRRRGAGQVVHVDATGGLLGRPIELPGDSSASIAGPLSPLPLWCLFDDGRLATARSDRYEIRVLDAGGETRTIVRGPAASEPLDEADRAHLEKLLTESLRRRSGGRVDPEILAGMLQSVPFPETRPVLGGLRCEGDSLVWIRRAAAVTDMGEESLRVGSAVGYGSPVWDVIDLRDGTRRVALLPGSFRLTRLRDRVATGIHSNELGVQTVARLLLR